MSFLGGGGGGGRGGGVDAYRGNDEGDPGGRVIRPLGVLGCLFGAVSKGLGGWEDGRGKGGWVENKERAYQRWSSWRLL